MSTRPIESNGLGLGVAAAVANLEQFLKFLIVFEETESVALQLRQLVLTFAIRGKRVHDAGIVATMLAHIVRVLVNRDGDDFVRSEEIEVVSLEDVLSRTKPVGQCAGGEQPRTRIRRSPNVRYRGQSRKAQLYKRKPGCHRTAAPDRTVS